MITHHPLEPTDLTEVQKWLNNEEVHRNLYVMYHPMTMHSLTAWYDHELTGGGHLFKFTNDKNEMTGLGLVHYIHEKNRCGEISIIVNPEYSGRGLGKKILLNLLRYCFDILNLNKVFLHSTAFNERMISLLGSLGMTLEGTFRKELFYNGQYHDILRWGLLADEYRSSDHILTEED